MLGAMGAVIFMWQDGWFDGILNRRRAVRAGPDGRVDVRQFQERSIVAVSVHRRVTLYQIRVWRCESAFC